MNKNWKIETLAVQAGYEPGNGDPRIVPIAQSTTYKYDDVQSVADLFDLKRDGFFYTRLANPTVDAFEKKIAAMEKGVAAVAFSSGQSANAFALLNLASAGDHIVSSSCLYGGTFTLFSSTLKRSGLDFTFVQPHPSREELERAIRPNTKAIFLESLANPALSVPDFELFSEVAHKHGIPVIVDNTFPTPVLCNPFDFGADFVTHSTTKYIDGHATSVGGIVVEKGGFDWSEFPSFTQPDPTYHGLIYAKDFAAAPYSAKMRAQLVRDYGVPMMPFNAFLSQLGAETLALRMERHCSNALELAEFLSGHPKVAWVRYPFLKGDSEYEMAHRYLKGGSGVLTFGVKGGSKAGEWVMNHLKLAAIVVHVADTRTGVLHPASMTHRQLSEKEQIAAGVLPELIRVSVGIENVKDIMDDFDQALNSVQL